MHVGASQCRGSRLGVTEAAGGVVAEVRVRRRGRAVYSAPGISLAGLLRGRREHAVHGAGEGDARDWVMRWDYA